MFNKNVKMKKQIYNIIIDNIKKIFLEIIKYKLLYLVIILFRYLS